MLERELRDNGAYYTPNAARRFLGLSRGWRLAPDKRQRRYTVQSVPPITRSPSNGGGVAESGYGTSVSGRVAEGLKSIVRVGWGRQECRPFLFFLLFPYTSATFT